MKNQKFLLIYILFSFFQMACFAQSDFDIIKQRILVSLMKPQADEEFISNLVNTQKPDGTWPGINYEDVSREGFQHSRHLANMVSLGRAYKNTVSKFYKSEKVKNTLELSLKNWVDHDYFCENWWHNQIGTPDNLVSLMLIAGDVLPNELVEKAQPIIGRANLNATGARPSGDRIKIAGILAKNLLFIGDKNQFAEVIKVIESEIKFNTGRRGMQIDYSFHHREDRVNNTLSYGTGYADAFAEWAAYVSGTEYAFSTAKINQLTDYYLDGICKQMVYGKYEDTGTKNRDISRADDENAMGTTTPERLLKASDYRKPELETIIGIRKGEVEPDFSFDKYFWQTEYYVHQRPDYFTSVRMHSTRNRNMEVGYNSEGLKNHHRGDGTNYISVTGKEYLNTAPVFDWQKIPGTTIIQKPKMPAPEEIQKPGLTDFVGAVTNGLYGAVGYDFKSPHDPLSAKKAWFFFDEEYVCLGAGITSKSEFQVATTLNQCLLKGEVIANTGGILSLQEKGERQIGNVNWIFHDSIGYIFPKAANIWLSNRVQTGSWWDINKQYDTPKNTVSLDVFKLWFDHGSNPVDATCQYIVVPSTTIEKLKQNVSKTNIEILSNTPGLQAVKHKVLQICQIVFYKPGEIQLTDKLKLFSDNPGILMLKLDGDKIIEISIADPNRKLDKYHFSVTSEIVAKKNEFKALWDEKTGLTYISVDLPKDDFAGSSLTFKL